jgi:ribosomal protein S18 acetylase RimI-like enzyme
MSENSRWRKIREKDVSETETLLRAMEGGCVNACSKYLKRNQSKDIIWIFRGINDKIEGLIVHSAGTLIPVLRTGNEIPKPRFLTSFLHTVKIHSVQGIKEDVVALEDQLEKTGRFTGEINDYNLMGLDKLPDEKGYLSGPGNLLLYKPRLRDLDALAPLQEAYEREEVLPKGSTFNPLASRENLAGIITGERIFAAELDGKIVGKIHINAVSFTRYQIGGVYVHPDFRGKGIARRMATEFTASLIMQGRGVTLFVRKNNAAASRLYENIGFTACGNYRISYY